MSPRVNNAPVYRFTGSVRARLEFGQALILEVQSLPERIVIRVEGCARLRHMAEERTFDGSNPQDAADAFRGIGDHVSEISISPAGRLQVLFGDGAELSVEPDPDYEAWQLTRGHQVWIGLPGGGVG